MTLPRFLDCAFTLIFDEYQRLGMDVLTAMEKLQDWGLKSSEPVVRPVTEAVKNTEALNDLRVMLASVGKG